MKGKSKKIRGLFILLLVMVISVNSKFLLSIAKDNGNSVNAENIVANADVNLEKYINYENETEKGLLVQYEIATGIEYKNNENHVPLSATGILFYAPKIENNFPTSVDVIAKSTLLTNGSSEGKDYKVVYNKEKGEIGIVTFNSINEGGKIYSEYKQNAKDSFSVILNYGETEFNGENIERTLNTTGKVIEILNAQDDIRIEQNFENEVQVKENISNLISTKVENTKIYNGYIKSNIVNGTNYETNYKENVEINISKQNQGTKKIDLKQYFINKNNETIETENIIFKSSLMEKQKILDILGEEGYLKILDNQGKTLGELNKDTQTTEDGTYKVEYPEGTTSLTLELSNPEKVGNITIQNEKEITPEEKNLDLVKIQEVYNENEITNIDIQESQTKITINPSQTTWTNEKQNEIEFDVKLYNNSGKYNMFKNPIIAIQLPKETEKVILEDASIINGNGLTIKNTEYNSENKIIKVELQGEQTKYLSQALENGTTLKIPATIILSNNIESEEIELKSAYQNENKYSGEIETGIIKNKIILENFNPVLTANQTIKTVQSKLTSIATTPENIVPTAQGISLSVTPVIGDVTRDTVYEGEFIKYEITATNTTEQDIDNVKIVATLPEGVKYGELVREDHEPNVESYYDFEKQMQPIELGTIKAGKTGTTYFEVQVNDLAEEETQKEITTKIQAFVGEGLSDEKNVTHKVENADYKVFLSSSIYRKNEFKYKLKIKGNIQEKTNVKINLPECIEPWAVICDLGLSTQSKEFTILENENALVIEVEPDEYTKAIEYGTVDDGSNEYEYNIFTRVILSKIEKQPNESSAEIKAIAMLDDIKSNENRTLLEYETIYISMTSDNEGEKVKFGEEINYEIKIINKGKSNYSSDDSNYVQLNIKDYLPDQLIPKEIAYNDFEYDSENGEFIEKSHNEEIYEKDTDENGNVLPNIDIYVNIPYQKAITINIKTLAGIVSSEQKIVNTVIASGIFSTAIDTQQSNEVSHIILPYNYDENNKKDPTEPEQPEKYSITGLAWNDENEDGQKQDSEQLIPDIQTYLMNSNGSIIKETKTANDGKYSFTDIETGEYNVIFKYDTNKYKITKYKASGVSEELNSDAMQQNVVINGENIVAGVTEEITLNNNIENINIGLIANKDDDHDKEEPKDPEDSKKYSISGLAWNDKNEDGEKQDNEQTISGVQTYLMDSKGSVIKETKTANDGKYSFNDIEVGEYNVIFKYDTNKYKITKYKASGVSEKLNSDVVQQNVVINGENIVAGVTEEISLNKNIEDINIGLVENKKFDFKVDNYISKITIKTANGTTEIPYSNSNLAKAEIKAKEIEGATVTVEYKIVVTNNGEIAGTVGKVIDYLPQGLNISNESSSIWIGNTDGSYINTSLANQTIESGKSVELTLIATKTMNENSTGTLTNKVIIDELSNELNIKETSTQNNTSKADLILSISTGLIIYVSLATIFIIGILIFLNIKFNIFKNIKLRFFSIIIILLTIIIGIGNSDIKAAGTQNNNYYQDEINITLTSDIRIRYRNTNEGGDGNGYHDFWLYTHAGTIYYVSDKYFSVKNTEKLKFTDEGVEVYDDINAYYNEDCNRFYPYQEFGFSEGVWKNLFLPGKKNVPWDMNDTWLFMYTPNDWRASIENGEINAQCMDADLPATDAHPKNDTSLGIVATYEKGYEGNYYPTETHYYTHTFDETERGILDSGQDEFSRKYWDWHLSVTEPKDIYEMQDTQNLKITDNGERTVSNRTIELKEKDGIVIIGPFNLTSNSNTNYYDAMTMYLRDGISVSLSPCDSNGNFLSSALKGNTGKFYFRVSTDYLKEHKGISYILIHSKDEPKTEKLNIEGTVVKYYYREGDQPNSNGSHQYQRFVKVEEDSNGEYVPKYESINEHYETTVIPQDSIIYQNFQGALTIKKSDELGKDENGNPLSLEGIYFVVNRSGYGWVKKVDGTYEYGDWDNNVVKLRTNADGTVDPLIGLDTDLTGNNGGGYMIYEIIEALPGGDSQYNLPTSLKDYYKATYENGLWECPYSLKATRNGNVNDIDANYTNKEFDLKDGDPDNDGNHIWIESGEFWSTTFTNTRDYVSLQIHKIDEIKNGQDLSGIEFKVFKKGSGWVSKVNDNDEHSNVSYGKFESASVLKTNSNGATQILRRLDSDGKYIICETKIPSNLQDRYKLENASTAKEGSLLKNFYDDYIRDYSYRPDEVNIKLPVDSNGKEKTKCQSIYKDDNGNILNEANTGKFNWTAINKRDYVSLQINKKDQYGAENEGLDLSGIKFKIFKKGGKTDDGWVRKTVPRDNDEEARYGNFDDEDVVELVTDKKGNTPTLTKLENEASYIICETFIPDRLADYYTLYDKDKNNNYKTFFEEYIDNYLIDSDKIGKIKIKLVASENTNDQNKIKLQMDTFSLKLREYVGYNYNTSTYTYTSYFDDNGVFHWNAINTRDYFSLQMHKENTKNENLEGIKFSVYEKTGSDEGNWIATNRNDGEYSTIPESAYNAFGDAAKCETDKNGDTIVIKRIPIVDGRTYSIYEVDVGDYFYLYNVGTFTLREDGPTYDGHKIQELTVSCNENEVSITTESGDSIKLKDSTNGKDDDVYIDTRKDAEGKDIYDVFVVKEINDQTFGAYQLEKLDKLTDKPLKGIGIKIYCSTPGHQGWLQIEKNNLGEYEVVNTVKEFTDVKEIYTDANGKTPVIYQVPISNGTVSLSYIAYETSIPDNLTNYFALKDDFEDYYIGDDLKQKSFFDGFVVTSISNDGKIYMLNTATGNKIVYNDMDYFKSTYKNELDISKLNDYRDLIKNLGATSITKEIDPEDNTKPAVTQFKAENDQTFINISGNVWEDGLAGKNTGARDDKYNVADSKEYNGTDKDYLDYNIQNIKVTLLKRIPYTDKATNKTELWQIEKATTYTDEDGKYSFKKLKIKDLANYCIKFTYDGITYQSVVSNLTTEDVSIPYQNGTRTIKQPSSITSKATEDKTARSELNNSFDEITGEGQTLQNGAYSGTKLSYTKTGVVTLDNTYAPYWKRANTNHPKTVVIYKDRTYDFEINATIDSAGISGKPQRIIEYYYNLMANNGYEGNGKKLLTEIPNLNLGLYRREQPNLTLQKDIYKADLSINGKKFTYMYNQKLLSAENVSTAVDFDGDYNLPIYEADVFYGDEDKGSNGKGEQLSATITYKIKLQNASTNLYTKINKIKDYYSTDYRIDKIYISDSVKPDASFFNDNNNLWKDNNITITPSSVQENGKTYVVNEIKFNKAIELDAAQTKKTNTKYLYIQYKIPIDKLRTIYDSNNTNNTNNVKSTLENIAEISSYSVFSDKDFKNLYAHVDSTSIPNNMNPLEYKDTNEDDSDKAPGLVIVEPKQRTVSGMVFEDAPVKIFTYNNVDNNDRSTQQTIDGNSTNKIESGEERIGDGIYNTSSDNNMQDSDGKTMKDKGIKGVKVKLVSTNSNEGVQFWNGTNWVEATATTENDGAFKFEGYVPGNYKVEFVWGENAGGKDVTRYKGTVFTNPKATTRGSEDYDQTIEYNTNRENWLKDSIRYSDAIDDYIRRLAIDMKSLGITKEAYLGEEDLYDKVSSYFNDKKGEDSADYMHSSTAGFAVEIENNGTTDTNGQYANKDGLYTNSNELENENFSGFTYELSNVDFGIIERPKRSMSVTKHVKSLKIVTPEGRPVVIATIGIDGKINAIAGESYISGGFNLGYLWAQIDKKMQQSMNVELEYEITVKGNSEKDYDDVRYYLYGNRRDPEKELKLTADKLYDYLGGANITSESEAEDQWQAVDITNDGFLKVPNDSKDMNKTVTEGLILEIYDATKTNYKNRIKQYIEGNGIFENYENKEEAIDMLVNIYTNWYDTCITKNKNTNITAIELRKAKLSNREIVQCAPDNVLVKDPYTSVETRTGNLRASKTISAGDEIDFNNDVEIAAIGVDKTQKTGANADPTYAPLYDRSEYVTISPATGENKDYVGLTVAIIGILTVFASGIILIKRFIKNRNNLGNSQK